MRSRFRFLIILAIISLGILLPSIVHAQPYYYRWQSGVVNFDCSTVMGGILVIFSSQPVEWDLPTGATYTINYITNGIETPSGPFALPSGVGTQLFASLAMNGTAYPTTFEVRMDTIIGGNVVYTSAMSANCTADSTGTPATITNVDLTAPIPSGGSAGIAPAFTDGRLNPQPYAPVVLYCGGDGNRTLNAFAVNVNQGALVWSYEFDSDDAPDVDSVVESGGGSTLFHFANGRYGVLATQIDGKGYLFVFDGCPNVGIPQVFVTDPVSGQFVQTQ